MGILPKLEMLPSLQSVLKYSRLHHYVITIYTYACIRYALHVHASFFIGIECNLPKISLMEFSELQPLPLEEGTYLALPGSSFTVTCQPGAYLSGSNILTCNDRGEFNEQLPSCIRKFEYGHNGKKTPIFPMIIRPTIYERIIGGVICHSNCFHHQIVFFNISVLNHVRLKPGF